MNRRIIGYYNYTVLLTYLGMVSACVGLFLAIDGKSWLSVWCLMFAGLCDMFDGAIASTKQRDDNQKRFGIQIDSLCDLIGFGVLPGVIGYSLSDNKLFAGFSAIFITLAAVIRLAYFNVLEENRQKEESCHRKTYLGVPVTTIALILPVVFMLNVNGVIVNTLIYQAATLLVGIGFLTPIYINKPQLPGKLAIITVGLLEAVSMFCFGHPV